MAMSRIELNAVVRDGHQRAGHFRTNGLSIYEEAPSRGMKFVVGVANEKRTEHRNKDEECKNGGTDGGLAVAADGVQP